MSLQKLTKNANDFTSNSNVKVFLVGGAVRDLAMGLKPKDLDWVVVGVTPEDMLAKGFKQVGADFPVFLHETTGEEYALARVEKKRCWVCGV